MRTRLWILVLSGMGVGSPAWADDSVARAHQAVLDRAVILAGLQFTRPPLVLTSTLPWTASAGAEAWTTCDADDHGDRIFVYTGSALFQCATRGGQPDWGPTDLPASPGVRRRRRGRPQGARSGTGGQRESCGGGDDQIARAAELSAALTDLTQSTARTDYRATYQ